MPPDCNETFKPHLDSREELVWCGRPAAKVVLRVTDIFLIPILPIWIGALLLVLNHPRAIWIFIVVSCWFLIAMGWFFWDAYQRKRTRYGITASRILIYAGGKAEKFKAYSIPQVLTLSITEKKDGSGTISWSSPETRAKEPQFNLFYRSGQFEHNLSWIFSPFPKLEFIPEVRKVYAMLLRIQQGKPCK